AAACVEKSSRHSEFIRRNLEVAGLDKTKLELRVQDAFTALAQLAAAGRQFDLILADPPYGEKNIGRRSTSFAQRLLDDTHFPALLAGEGLFILGHTKRDTLSFPDVWRETKMLKHGDTVMRFLQVQATATP